MSSNNSFKFLAFILVSAVLLAMAVPAVFAAEANTAAAPDIMVIMGGTGSSISRANVYVDGNFAGVTDLKGNFTFKAEPAAGNHTILISARGINNTTMTTDLAHKPIVINVAPAKGLNLSIHLKDGKTGQDLAGAVVYNYKYAIGTTDAKGYLNVTQFPMGFYLIKINKDGYVNKTTLLVAYYNKTQAFSLSPK